MRVRYGMPAPDIEDSVGLCLHLAFTSIKKVWDQFDGQHLVVCLEGKSWRKSFYPEYKANRKIKANARSKKEIEDDVIFFDVMKEFVEFMDTKTNATVLQHQAAEADDLIARWIALHPDDTHTIVSSDSDFRQLISNNVNLYNGIAGLLYTTMGIFDKDNKIALDKKGNRLPIPNPEWLLFEKCLRGDPTDNIMSAFPGVRKAKLEAAWNDHINQGFDWNNLMLSKWSDHEGKTHIVKDDYARNQKLIDLSKIPEIYADQFDDKIYDKVNDSVKSMVGVNLIKFCNRHGLVRIEKNASDYSTCLSARYNGHLLEQTNEKT